MILINNTLTICKTHQSEYDEINVDEFPLFLSKYAISKKRIVFFDTADELTKYFPIYFIQRETLDIKGIYFTDKYSRNNAFDLFKECLKKASPEANNTVVKLVKTNKIIEETNKITCALNISNTQNENDIKNMYDYEDDLNFDFDEPGDDIKSVHTSLIEWDIENEYQRKYIKQKTNALQNRESYFNTQSSAFNNFKNILYKRFYDEHEKLKIEIEEEVESTNESVDLDMNANTKCCGLLKANDFVTIDLRFEKVKNNNGIDNMLIYSTSKGIFKVHRGETTKLWNQEARKIMYSNDTNLLLYQIEDVLYVSVFETCSTVLKPQKINLNISSFFIGKDDNCVQLILSAKTNDKFNILYVLGIYRKDEFIEIKFEKSMYVGANADNINFINNKFVVACNDFEVVDTATLKMQKLIEMYDPFTSAFLKPIPNLRAKSIFKMKRNLYLVCFSGVGFYIDGMGKYVYAHLSFNWEDEAMYFRIYKKWIIVLSKNYLSMFCLETSKLNYHRGFKNGQFVINSEKLMVFNEEGVFIVVITKDLVEMKISKSEIVGQEFTKNKADSDDAVIKNKSKKPKIRKVKVKSEKDNVFVFSNSKATISDENICDILADYEEKYKNYKLISLKLVSK